MTYAKPLFIAAIVLLVGANPIAAHRWNMRTFSVDWEMDAEACNRFILDLAGMVNTGMVKKGYSPGRIWGGIRAFRLDGVGGSRASYYFYCARPDPGPLVDLLIFTSHTPDEDSPLFDDMYQEMLDDFVKIRNNYRNGR